MRVWGWPALGGVGTGASRASDPSSNRPPVRTCLSPSESGALIPPCYKSSLRRGRGQQPCVPHLLRTASTIRAGLLQVVGSHEGQLSLTGTTADVDFGPTFPRLPPASPGLWQLAACLTPGARASPKPCPCPPGKGRAALGAVGLQALARQQAGGDGWSTQWVVVLGGAPCDPRRSPNLGRCPRPHPGSWSVPGAQEPRPPLPCSAVSRIRVHGGEVR